MLSTDEIIKRIETAEQNVSAQDFDERKYPLGEVINDLSEVGPTSTVFDAPTVLRLAEVLKELGDGLDINNKDSNLVFKHAQEVLNKGVEMYPDNIDLLNDQRRLYFTTEQWDKARDLWKSVINKTPPAAKDERLEALVQAGACSRELRDFPDASDMFRQAVELEGGTTVRLLIERGWLFFYLENYDAAHKDFEEAQSRAEAGTDDKHEAMSGRIASLQAEDALNPDAKQDRAREVMRDWRKDASRPSDEKLAEILYYSDNVHTRLNLYQAALLNYDLLLGLDSNLRPNVDPELLRGVDPDNCKAWQSKIAGLKWLRRYRDAEDLYRKAQAKFPDNIDLWKEMADVYYRQKRFSEAYSYFSGKALEESAKKNQTIRAFLDNLKKNDEAVEWTIASLRKMRNLKEARRVVDEALAIRGDRVSFLSEKAVIDFTERKYDSAKKFFDRALAINEYNEFALQWRAASYRKSPKMVKATSEADKETPDFTEAKAKLNEAVQKLPAATGVLEEYAWLALDQGDLISAGKYFDEAIKLDPYMINRQFSRIQVYAQLNLTEEALDVFRKLEEQFPEDAQVAEELSWFHLRLGNLERAREKFESIEANDPGNVLGINARGGYELKRRNYFAAERCFRKAIDKVAYEPQYHINLAWALLGQLKEPGEMPSSILFKRDELLEKARKSCRNALELDPYNAKAHGCLGVIAYKRNALRDAEAYFLESIKLSPQEGSYVELSALYCQMGRFDDARKMLKEAVDLNKLDARAFIEWGNLSVMTENNNDAVRYCRNAVNADPNNDETHRALAIALIRAEQYDAAEGALRRGLSSIAPSRQWQLYLLLSQVSVRKGDIANKDRKKKDMRVYDEALTHIDNARRDNPSPNADIFFHAGIVQYKRADYQSAQKYFAECVKANRDRFEADRYGSIVQAALDREKRLFKINKWYGIGLAIICSTLLIILWALYYGGKKRTILLDAKPEVAVVTKTREPHDEFLVDSNLLIVMTPILLGLLVVAGLLPNLNTLKLPGGFEAGMNEPKAEESEISSGPQGEIGFGSSLPIISPEPR